MINRLWERLHQAPGRFWRWATNPDNSRLLWGYIVWGAMGAVVALPELWAAVASKDVPFPTISGTIGYIEYWHPEFALLVIGVNPTHLQTLMGGTRHCATHSFVCAPSLQI